MLEQKMCVKCGSVLSGDAKFCPNCGAPSQVSSDYENNADKDDLKYCKNCGEQILPNAEFCPKCGTKQEPNFTNPKNKVQSIDGGKIMIYVGFGLSICSMLFAFFSSGFAIACGIIGVVLNVIARKDEITDKTLQKFNKAGFILGIIGCSLSVIIIIYVTIVTFI